MGKYGVTDIDKILDILGGRVAQGPQGALTSKAGLANSGYSTVTDEKNAVTGLGHYRRAQDTAIQQLLSQASTSMADHARQAAAMDKTRMEDAFSANEAVAHAPADAQWASMASNYAGQSADLYAQQHPAPPPAPPVPSVDRAGSYGGSSNVFAADPAAQAKLVNPAMPSPAAQDPTVRAAQQQQVTAAHGIPQMAGTEQRLTDAYTEMGRAGASQQEAVDRQGAQQKALDELLYGSEAPYDVNAAIEMGIDPLVAEGQFADTPSEQIAGYRQGRDLQSLNENGMLYDEAQAQQKQQETADTKARQDALDQLIQGSVGMSPQQATFQSGLPTDQLTGVLSSPDWQQQSAAEDQMINGVLAGDTDQATNLIDFLNADDIDPTRRRLLRARMNQLGISDTELANIASG